MYIATTFGEYTCEGAIVSATEFMSQLNVHFLNILGYIMNKHSRITFVTYIATTFMGTFVTHT